MEDWEIALIVLGIIALCIIITSVLAHYVNKSNWKSRYHKKIQTTQIVSSLSHASENVEISSQQNLPYPPQDTVFPPVGFQNTQQQPTNGSVQSVLDPSTTQSFHPPPQAVQNGLIGFTFNSEESMIKTRL